MHHSAWRQIKIPRRDLSCFDLLILLIIQVRVADFVLCTSKWQLVRRFVYKVFQRQTQAILAAFVLFFVTYTYTNLSNVAYSSKCV